jgi:hypothetical protein
MMVNGDLRVFMSDSQAQVAALFHFRSGSNRLLKFTQPSTPAEQREKMTASPDEQ